MVAQEIYKKVTGYAIFIVIVDYFDTNGGFFYGKKRTTKDDIKWGALRPLVDCHLQHHN